MAAVTPTKKTTSTIPPSVDASPAVATVLARHAEVGRELAAAKKLRATLEREVEARGGRRVLSPVNVEARRIAGMQVETDTTSADLAAADQRVQEYTEASALLKDQIRTLRQQAATELAGEARAYAMPAIRRVVVAHFDSLVAQYQLALVQSSLVAAGHSPHHAAPGLTLPAINGTMLNEFGRLLAQQEQAGVLTREECAAYRTALSTHR